VVAALTPFLPKNVPIFSSPLRRCSELAALLSDALGAVVRHDPRLVEMNFGAWEMRSWNDIPRTEIDAWANDLHAYRPGGGENVLDVEQRIRSFLDDLQRQCHESAIVVCHAGTIRMLSACRRHCSSINAALAAAQTENRIGYGELIVLDFQIDNGGCS
jgi:alpha-ribazole phosphatase